MPQVDAALFARLERFYDGVPRFAARVENVGPLVLFIGSNDAYPLYARPALEAGEKPSAADITAVRRRQRDIGAPEAFEWVHETSPDLLAVARSAGLSVLEAPLMVLDPDAMPPIADDESVSVRLLSPDDPSFAGDVMVRQAVAAIGFTHAGTGTGAAGAAERDAALTPLSAGAEALQRRRAAEGRAASALAELREPPGAALSGVVGSGMYQREGDVAEIVGVATLPAARHRGVARAVTAALARHALEHGAGLVFLSAASADVAAMYARLGFRRVGTACIAEPEVAVP
ncbi:GNAT family N-acetyltransferase [Catenuloplanes atrovinosus]|uniref:Ribosomal protein S18 acetylase RimI-like enzyme n=1 Tax=Catenuloplanes atrovinosus TaxID=137266 RepID=A0AAE4CBH5_9ACTN|nr:GNAT family N-acetyltransferase [Catenuloplanes atrovinosus]MDR7278098.1 ribosomal protein S18 acetylase RimI-like enzyme [Catenuloplanes atrovinosus]